MHHSIVVSQLRGNGCRFLFGLVLFCFRSYHFCRGYILLLVFILVRFSKQKRVNYIYIYIRCGRFKSEMCFLCLVLTMACRMIMNFLGPACIGTVKVAPLGSFGWFSIVRCWDKEVRKSRNSLLSTGSRHRPSRILSFMMYVVVQKEPPSTVEDGSSFPCKD